MKPDGAAARRRCMWGQGALGDGTQVGAVPAALGQQRMRPRQRGDPGLDSGAKARG